MKDKDLSVFVLLILMNFNELRSTANNYFFVTINESYSSYFVHSLSTLNDTETFALYSRNTSPLIQKRGRLTVEEYNRRARLYRRQN